MMVLSDGWKISLQDKHSELSSISIIEGNLQTDDGTPPILQSGNTKIILK